MRIDAYNQVNMVYATAGKTQLKKTAKTSTTEDKLEISQLGRDELPDETEQFNAYRQVLQMTAFLPL